jgi:hypothetical protein
MAGQTTNYLFNYPTSTDYVKDGATAIQTLATNVDTAMNAALSTKPAMAVLLNASTFSAASSVTIDNVFTTAYDNYRIIFNTTAVGAAGNMTATLRTSAPADLNAASYTYVTTGFSASSPTTPASLGASTGATSAVVGYTNGASNSLVLDILNPALVSPTMFTSKAMAASTTDIFSATTAAVYKVSAAAAGIRFNFGLTSTGTVKIYGYRNS